jgi:predicted RNase H-like HicB family nuclease
LIWIKEVPAAFPISMRPAGLLAREGAMTDTSYYSVIDRDEQGKFLAWVPDLPGLKVRGETEQEVIRALSKQVRQCVRDMILSGRQVPQARPADELTRETANRRLYRLLLLIG